MTTQSVLTLNYQYPSIANVSYAVQGDRLSRQIVAHLVDGSARWEAPAGTYGVIRVAKPDGTICFYDALEDGSPAVTFDGSTATLGLAEQALTAAGEAKMSLSLYSAAGARLTTFRLTLVVTPDAVADNVISGNYISVLTALLTEMQEIGALVQAGYGAPLTASTPEEMTDTDRAYVYTGTTGGGFMLGNWYYWNGSAWVSGGVYNSADPAAAEAAAAAQQSASNARAYAQAAAGSAVDAQRAKADAQTSAEAAESSAETAAQHVTAAETAKIDAQSASNEAAGSATSASQYYNGAYGWAMYAEGYANGKQGGQDPSGGSVYYHNNAKYYSEQAAASAESAAGSAEDAAASAEDAQIEGGYALKAFVVETASGDVVSITDGADEVPVKALRVGIDPVQDLHGYDAPWVGGAGKNKYGGLQTVQLRENTSAIQEDVDLPAGTYTVTYQVAGDATVKGIRFKASSSDSGYLYEVTRSGQTITLTRAATIAEFYQSDSDVSLGHQAYFSAIQIESGSQATAWTPYENICPISGWTGVHIYRAAAYDAQAEPYLAVEFPTEAGTVYGGTLDVTTGLLTVDSILYPASEFLKQTQNNGFILYRRENCAPASAPLVFKCSMFSTNSSSINSGNLTDERLRINTNTNTIYFSLLETRDKSDFQIFYKIAEPVTYQLTPAEVKTLLGANSIWADTGDTTVEYRADTKLYVDKQIAQLQALVLES